MKIVIDIDDEMVCNDIKNKTLEPTSATDEVIINALYNGTPIGNLITMYECPNCGEIRSVPFRTCPNCGANMVADLCSICKHGDNCERSDKGISFANHSACWKFER